MRQQRVFGVSNNSDKEGKTAHFSQADSGQAGALSYAAFALGFILPCAQRCFSRRDSFLRAAALIRPRLRTFRAAFG